MDVAAIMTAGLIVNPKSGKSSGKGLALAAKVRGKSGAVIHILDDFAGLESVIIEMARAGVTDLFISSGDGTIQAIQTIIAEHNPFPTAPRLVLLPHGTTNMTAADLGFRRRSIDAQAAAMFGTSPAETAVRPTLRVANPADGKVRHGMFLGTGAIWTGTKFCQDAIHRTGLKGDFATFATLASAVARSLFTRADPNDPNRIDRAYPIAVAPEGHSLTPSPQLFMLATTLDKLILGTKPFWAGKTAPIRATTIPYPVPSVARWLVPLMYGSEDRRTPAGARSFCAGTLAIASTTPFVIDGEFFEPPTNAPLRVETGPEFTYVR
jgi:diacylglycerol kinase (ATP)